MARARNIKPGFFLNDDLAELDPLTRLLFAGLWCIADRDGRLNNKPKKIKAQVLPYDDCDISSMLNDLEEAQFIVQYEADDIEYIQIVNFAKHQNPHKNESKSVIPPPSEKTPYKHSTSTVQVQEMHTSNRADSLNPITDSLNLIPDTLNTETPDCSGEESEDADSPRSPFKTLKQQEQFDIFYSEYPKKRSKGQAEKAWVKISPGDDLVSGIMAGLKNARASPQWIRDEGKYIPYPASWLNAKGWEDVYETRKVVDADDKFSRRGKSFCDA